MSYQTDVRRHKRSHPTKKKEVRVRKHTRHLKGSRSSTGGQPPAQAAKAAAAIADVKGTVGDSAFETGYSRPATGESTDIHPSDPSWKAVLTGEPEQLNPRMWAGYNKKTGKTVIWIRSGKGRWDIHKIKTDRDGRIPKEIAAERLMDVADGDREGRWRNPLVDFATTAKVRTALSSKKKEDRANAYRWFIHPNESDAKGLDVAENDLHEILPKGKGKRKRHIILSGGTEAQRKAVMNAIDNGFTVKEKKVLAGTLIRIKPTGKPNVAGYYYQRTDFSGKPLGAPTIVVEPQYATDEDLVVVDEAHHLTAREYGSKIDRTKNYQLLEKLRERTSFFLFLTATPHQGEDDRFAMLLKLLDPEIVISTTDLGSLGSEINDLMGRNIKAEVTDFDGNRLFKGHDIIRHEVTPSEKYSGFLDELKQFVAKGLTSLAERSGVRISAENFVLTSFLKLASSSPEAIKRTLLHRHDNLKKGVSGKGIITEHDYRFEGEHEERCTSEVKEIFKGEMNRIDNLLTMLEGIEDPKLNELNKILEKEDILDDDLKRLLIFTEYRGTQDLIKEHLEEIFGKESVLLINGDMDTNQKKNSVNSLFQKAVFREVLRALNSLPFCKIE